MSEGPAWSLREELAGPGEKYLLVREKDQTAQVKPFSRFCSTNSDIFLFIVPPFFFCNFSVPMVLNLFEGLNWSM